LTLQNIEFSNIKFTSEVSFEIKISKLIRASVTKDIEVSKKDYECIKVTFEAIFGFLNLHIMYLIKNEL